MSTCMDLEQPVQLLFELTALSNVYEIINRQQIL